MDCTPNAVVELLPHRNMFVKTTACAVYLWTYLSLFCVQLTSTAPVTDAATPGGYNVLFRSLQTWCHRAPLNDRIYYRFTGRMRAHSALRNSFPFPHWPIHAVSTHTLFSSLALQCAQIALHAPLHLLHVSLSYTHI